MSNFGDGFLVIKYLTEITTDNIIFPCTLRRVIRNGVFVCIDEKGLCSCKDCNTIEEYRRRKIYE